MSICEFWCLILPFSHVRTLSNHAKSLFNSYQPDRLDDSVSKISLSTFDESVTAEYTIGLLRTSGSESGRLPTSTGLMGQCDSS